MPSSSAPILIGMVVDSIRGLATVTCCTACVFFEIYLVFLFFFFPIRGKPSDLEVGRVCYTCELNGLIAYECQNNTLVSRRTSAHIIQQSMKFGLELGQDGYVECSKPHLKKKMQKGKQTFSLVWIIMEELSPVVHVVA